MKNYTARIFESKTGHNYYVAYGGEPDIMINILQSGIDLSRLYDKMDNIENYRYLDYYYAITLGPGKYGSCSDIIVHDFPYRIANRPLDPAQIQPAFKYYVPLDYTKTTSNLIRRNHHD